MNSTTVCIVSELFYPEDNATGYLLTRIAEGLAADFQVVAICGQPSYSGRGIRAPRRETYKSIRIFRCWATTLDKNVLLFKLLNTVMISCSIFLNLVRKLNRNDCVIVVTNPPVLPFLTVLACRMRGARCLLLIHDVYPESLVAAGLARRDSIFTKLIFWLTRKLYRAVERIIVLGRDMEQLAIGKVQRKAGAIVVIPNWADIEEVVPSPRHENLLLSELGFGTDRFVVQYAGNMGRTHGIEVLFEAAALLRKEPEYQFLFIGSGAKKAWLQDRVRHNALQNVTILPNRPRHDQCNFLNACDIAIISFLPGMAGVSVPSRLYNIMSAGKPVIGVCEPHSELALVIEEEKIGWVVPPGDSIAVANAIRAARSDADALKAMSNRARTAAVEKYSLSRAVDSYAAVITGLDPAGRSGEPHHVARQVPA